jgi:hypothetical protein
MVTLNLDFRSKLERLMWWWWEFGDSFWASEGFLGFGGYFWGHGGWWGKRWWVGAYLVSWEWVWRRRTMRMKADVAVGWAHTERENNTQKHSGLDGGWRWNEGRVAGWAWLLRWIVWDSVGRWPTLQPPPLWVAEERGRRRTVGFGWK